MVHSSAYKRMRQITQVLDTLIMDIDTLLYKDQALVLAVMFCVIGLSMKVFCQKELFDGTINPFKGKEITGKENISSNLLVEKSEAKDTNDLTQLTTCDNEGIRENRDALAVLKKVDNYVLLFSEFLQSEYSISYEELVPTIEYVSPFVGGIRFNFELPQAFTLSKRDLLRKRIHLQSPADLQSLLVHNKGAGAFVRWLKSHS